MIDYNKRVYVYWNLHRKLWSVRQSGLIVDHAHLLSLRDCKFLVGKAGQARVRREGKKNVHAYIKGHMWPSQLTLMFVDDLFTKAGYPAQWEQFRYDPRIYGAFLTDNKSRVIERAVVVELTTVCNAYGAKP